MQEVLNIDNFLGVLEENNLTKTATTLKQELKGSFVHQTLQKKILSQLTQLTINKKSKQENIRKNPVTKVPMSSNK